MYDGDGNRAGNRESPKKMNATCCIAGGGPAGIIAGYLLARAGVDVIVVEKHAGFFRDFRGDTIHPSTLRLMDELGHLDELLKIPHAELKVSDARVGERAMHLFALIPWLRRIPDSIVGIGFRPEHVKHVRPVAATLR